jgi:hypothetical protein
MTTSRGDDGEQPDQQREAELKQLRNEVRQLRVLLRQAIERLESIDRKIALREPEKVTAKSNSDEEIATRVVQHLRALKQANELHGYNLEITVDDAVVEISGFVDTDDEHDLVIETVRRTPGVRVVMNRLRIRPQPAPVKAPIGFAPQQIQTLLQDLKPDDSVLRQRIDEGMQLDALQHQIRWGKGGSPVPLRVRPLQRR